jgi:hypothetical protein
MASNDLKSITQKTKDLPRIPLKPVDELMCSKRVTSSCTNRVMLVTNPVICPERGKDRVNQVIVVTV